MINQKSYRLGKFEESNIKFHLGGSKDGSCGSLTETGLLLETAATAEVIA